ncbi:MAG TPA: hypothetical protein VHA13_00510, partial [Gammaproteobacteria bacterium]|nr:hypothetical protein [Gammaproteobacteria bacterium]
MTQPTDKKAKLTLIKNEDDERSGTTSQGGAIEFHDFINLNGSKLSAEQERQKLFEHAVKSGGLIDNERALREQYKESILKQNAISNYQYGSEMGMNNQAGVWEVHPIIGRAAEYADSKQSPNPNYNNAETNNDKKQELT